MIEAIRIIIEIGVLLFILFYIAHFHHFLGLIQNKKRGIVTKAEIISYGGKSTPWAKSSKNPFEFLYPRKKYHKYEVEFTEKETGEVIRQNLVVKENNLSVGDIVDIKYVNRRRVGITIVQEECIPWFYSKFWMYTVLFVLLLITGIFIEFGLADDAMDVIDKIKSEWN